MANKRNLSLVGLFGLALLTLSVVMCAAIPMHAGTLSWAETDDGDKSISPQAQVPPRSESRQEQRERLVREAKKDIRAWCEEQAHSSLSATKESLYRIEEPAALMQMSWPIEVLVVDKLATGKDKERIVFLMTCPKGKLQIPSGYSLEDMVLFWAWGMVQREE